MNEKKESNETRLIRSNSHGIIRRSTSLVQRGLQQLSKREPRVVSFPTIESVGTLFVADAEVKIWEGKQWLKIGEAIGDVVVQPGKKLILVSQAFDPLPLVYLKPYDLQGLSIYGWDGLCSAEIGTEWCSTEIRIDNYLDIIKGLVGLEWLSFEDASINSLGFVENLINLQGLDVSGTSICSLAPLQGLTNLRYLDLSDTETWDIEYLEDLTNLEELNLMNTPVGDFSYLRNLPKLRLLDISGTQCDDEEIAKLQEALPNCIIV